MLHFGGGPQSLLQHSTFTTSQGVRLLLVLFCFWKIILLTIVALAPGPGYDTSSTLLVDSRTQDISTASVGEVSTTLAPVVKFIRWDAIYFSQIARRGYVFEQEQAFAPGFPSAVDLIQRGNYPLL